MADTDRLVSALEDVLLDEERGGLGAGPSRRRVAEVLAHEAGKHEAAEVQRLREEMHYHMPQEGYCPACGCYAPLSLDGTTRVHECDRTPPLDDLPPTIYACPVCAGHGRSRWGCWGTKERPHEHAYMQPIHELIRAVAREALNGGETT